MEFLLLGPLVVRSGEAVVPLSRGKQRVVLAALLLSANRAVSLDEISEALWGTEPPPSAHATIRNYVRRLRRALGGAAPAPVNRVPRGYMISVPDSDLDVARFEALAGAVSDAARAGEWEHATAQARAALALWRGDPLSGVESDVLAGREVPRLAEMRLTVLQTGIDADLRLGRHADVVAELGELAAANPLRERLHVLLMLALYRCGRQADALAAYQRVRRSVVEEIGTEPGTELRDMHQRILTADPALGAPVAGPGGVTLSSPRQVVPRELPAAVPRFVGRRDELASLSGLIALDQRDARGTVVISAIGGSAGVGKTTLALHWAHQAAEYFPDGQLYVNLRGYDPGHPVQPSDALAGFLRALGVRGTDIPPELDERAVRYQSLVTRRRMLILLDNAGSTEQVRPLLPGTETCVTIVTSRDSLAGLTVGDRVWRIELDVLPEAEAVGLLRELIGSRVDAEPDAAMTLAARCCRLPLALRVAAELAIERTAESLTSVAAELADLQQRLDLLDADGDPRGAVRAVFSWSYRRLHPDAARAFRLAGLHPGPDFDRFTIAALAATSSESAGSALRLLAQAHLIQSAARHRYAMHDLLRAYARELADAEDGADAQRAALTRQFDHYLYTASAAMDVLFPAESHRRPRPSPPAGEVPPVVSPQEARGWLDIELPNLVAAIEHAAYHGWPDHAIRLAGTVFRALVSTGRYPEIITVYTCSLHAARSAADRAAEAEALNNLTYVDLRQGHYQHAADLLRQSLALHEETGDHLGQARALGNLGIVQLLRGRFQEAVRYQERALEHYRTIGDQAGEPRTLNNLGLALFRQGRYTEAADRFRLGLTLRPDPDTVSYGLANLGAALLRMGHYQDAVTNLSRALARSREAGNFACEAYCLVELGNVDLRQGHYQQAAGQFRRAVALSRKEGDQSREADALNGLGQVSLAQRRPAHARTQHSRALSLASQIGDRYEQARAHQGLGSACEATAAPEEATHHWQQALTIYTALAVPEATKVRKLLERTC